MEEPARELPRLLPRSLPRPPALLLLLGLLLASRPAQADDRKTASDLIRSRGFDVDEFDVISQSYVLKVYRVINPLADRRSLHKVPVVLHHGIAFDGSSMMAASRQARPRRPRPDERLTLYAAENGTDDRGLCFYLANNNYDVWLLDGRGSNEWLHRRVRGKHDKSFWDFSLDEQALIDLPTQMEFVLRQSQAKKLNYIAFSQSTTLMFALLSMRPEYADKLSAFVAIAPVVFTGHVQGIAAPVFMSRIYSQPSSAVSNVPEWLRRIQNFFLTYFCASPLIKQTLCRAIWMGFSGHDRGSKLEGGTIENVLKSTSLKAYEQFMDNMVNKDFRMYDYKDELRNMEEYGQPVPPQYNVSKITARNIVLFRGTSDFLSDPADQLVLLSRLRVPIYEDHVLEDYAHLDFIISPTVVRDVNEPILRALDQLSARPVKRVRHTLGEGPPNPQVQGTQLIMDVQKDLELSSDKQRPTANGAGARQGVAENANATTVREQLGLKPTA